LRASIEHEAEVNPKNAPTGRNIFSEPNYRESAFNSSDSTWGLIIFVLSLNSSRCSFNFISRNWPFAFTFAIRLPTSWTSE